MENTVELEVMLHRSTGKSEIVTSSLRKAKVRERNKEEGGREGMTEGQREGEMGRTMNQPQRYSRLIFVLVVKGSFLNDSLPLQVNDLSG